MSTIYALVENDVIVNKVEYESSPPDDGGDWRVFDDETMDIGWVWNEGQQRFVNPNPKYKPTDEERDEELMERFNDNIFRALFKVAFLQENRIRVLEGKNEITQQQFRQAVKNYIRN